MSFDIEYWLKTPKEEKVKGRKRKKLKLRLEAEAEAIDKAEDEANAKSEIESEKLEIESNVKQQEELKKEKFKKALEDLHLAMMSAIVENRPVDFQNFMTWAYLTFCFVDKREKKKKP